MENNNLTSLKEYGYLLRMEHVNKYYQSGNERIHALKDITLNFENKGLIFIIGPSGCGKSTLLNLLGGLDKPDEGRIYIEDADFLNFSKAELNSYLNSYMGFIFQEYNILKDLNLYDNIALPLEMQKVKRKEIKERCNKIIEQVGLADLKKRKINQLSGGQKQRIAVARALIKNPKMIIADEPTGNLDSVTSDSIFQLLKELSSDRLIIVVTHDLESAIRFGDRIIKIDDGMVVDDEYAPFNGEIKANDPIIDNSIKIQKVEVKKQNHFKSEETLHLTKVSAPIKTSIKLSLKNINHKKLRFILMTIICAMSLAFFSFVIELNGDKIRQNIYTSIDNNYVYADLTKKFDLPDDYVKQSIYDNYIGTQLSSGSYDSIKKDVKNLNIHEYQSVSILKADEFRLSNSFYTGEIEYLTRFDPDNDYKLYAGRKPIVGKHEIMLTDFVVAMLKNFDMYDKDITYEEIIGSDFTLISDTVYQVVGIIDTNYEFYTKFMKYDSIDDSNKLYYSYLNEYKMMNTVYLNYEDFLNEISNPMPKIKLSKSSLSLELSRYNRSLDLNNYTITTHELGIRSFIISTPSGNQTEYIGRNVDNTTEDYEIVVPYNVLPKIYYNLDSGEPLSFEDYSWTWYGRIMRYSNNVINLTVNNGTENFNISVKIVGVSDNNNLTIGINNSLMNFLYEHGPKNNSFILAEMSPFEEVAYRQFRDAYNKGYIIDLFKYRDDIDSYEISPFIKLLSRAGLFVFAVFTIGILWTIITLDIVDSKKEIGTFRSIGLSGSKISLIYIFQTLIITTIAYVIGLIVSLIVIRAYNNTIYDSLNLIHLSMYMMTYRSPLLLIAFLFLITTIALALPLYKIMSQRIIDVINEREDIL